MSAGETDLLTDMSRDDNRSLSLGSPLHRGSPHPVPPANDQVDSESTIVAHSAAMAGVLNVAKRIADLDSSVLITGGLRIITVGSRRQTHGQNAHDHRTEPIRTHCISVNRPLRIQKTSTGGIATQPPMVLGSSFSSLRNSTRNDVYV